jgi:endoribonuclease Dicer
MPSKSLAKRSVALEACRQLHQLKELDDSFLPIGKENLRLEEEEDYNADLEEENVPDTNPRPGTTKRRHYYYKQVADPFTNCLPQLSQPCYLYAITMVLTEAIPEEQNTRGRKIYKPETSTQSLGILSSKPIPQICPFPIFTRSGEVEVDVVQVEESVAISQEQLERISHFQRYIFKNVLTLEKDPMLFDPTNANCSYLIVPLRKKTMTNALPSTSVSSITFRPSEMPSRSLFRTRSELALHWIRANFKIQWFCDGIGTRNIPSASMSQKSFMS